MAKKGWFHIPEKDLAAARALLKNHPEYNDENYEMDYDEPINVHDAADMWMSSGKDEDYTFGYSIDDLEKALND